MKDVRIITISREFGSGGRSIGKKLAQELGVKYYDKELVKKIALESGFDPKYVEENGELAPAGNALAYAFNLPGTPGVMRGMSSFTRILPSVPTALFGFTARARKARSNACATRTKSAPSTTSTSRVRSGA